MRLSPGYVLTLMCLLGHVPTVLAQPVIPEGGYRTVLHSGEVVHSGASFDPEEIVPVIVQLTAPPLAGTKGLAGKQGREAALHALSAEQESFLSSVRPLLPASKGGGTPVVRTYREVLNGVAFPIARRHLSTLRQMPGVRHVEEDRLYRVDGASDAVVSPSHFPHAPRAGGAGVAVAFLDTGIDYRHPELGGGFGLGYRIEGGYDFQNGDGDPMDDHGHGTWVAGAAVGKTLGQAPDASVWAYKVCDAQGRCRASLVLAALDRALDRDDNPLTEDPVDVINLSLGFADGFGDDLLSLAVNEVVEAGVVCVVAAGNVEDDAGYHRIGSPGSAARALTVGAAGTGGVAAFSARGPGRGGFSIKPELVAPGVAVPTSEPGGGYGAHSGTSLAAPLVTAAVARLLEAHPDWDPERVKAVLMQHTSGGGADLFSQGNGHLALERALGAGAAMTPATLALGVIPGATSRDTTLTVHNLSDTAATFVFGIEGPAGLSAAFSPAVVTVPPRGAAPVRVSLSIDPAAMGPVDVMGTGWLPDVGALVAYGPADTLRVPLDVVRGAVLRLTRSPEGPFSYFVHDGQGTVLDGKPGSSLNVLDPETMLLNPGVYDVVATYGGFEQGPDGPEFHRWTVIREAVDVRGETHVEVYRSRATHRYDISAADENGDPLSRSPKWTMTRLEFQPTGTARDLMISGNRGFHEEHFSDASDRYRYRWYTVSDPSRRPYYHLKGEVTGFDDAMRGDLDVRRTRRYTVHYRVGEDIEDLWVLQFLGLPSGVGGAFAGTSLHEPLLTPPFAVPVYAAPDPSPFFLNGFRSGTFSEVLHPRTPGETVRSESDLLFVTPWYRIGEDGVLQTYFYLDPTRSILPVAGDHVTYGLGPTHWFGRMNNAPDRLSLRTNTDVGYALFAYPDGALRRFFPLFLNQLQDAPPTTDLAYRLIDGGGRVLAEAPLTDATVQDLSPEGYFDTRADIYLPAPGPYTLELEGPGYRVGGREGRSLVRLSMDTRRTDPNPPAMTALNVVAGGEYTDLVGRETPGTIRLELADAQGPVSVTLSLRGQRDSLWVPLALASEGDEYKAAIPDTLEPGFVSIRVRVVDASGNTLEYEAAPAFRFTDGPAPPFQTTPRYPADDGLVGEGRPLAWDPSEGTDTYRIQIATDAAFEWLVLDDSTVTGPSRFLPEGMNGGPYFWRVQARNAGGASPWSPVYRFTVGTLTGIEETDPGVPDRFGLGAAYPNPFAGRVSIPYALPTPARVRLRVFDLLGRQVALLEDGLLPAGRYRAEWDASSAPAGVYFYEMEAGAFRSVGKVVHLR